MLVSAKIEMMIMLDDSNSFHYPTQCKASTDENQSNMSIIYRIR